MRKAIANSSNQEGSYVEVHERGDYHSEDLVQLCSTNTVSAIVVRTHATISAGHLCKTDDLQTCCLCTWEESIAAVTTTAAAFRITLRRPIVLIYHNHNCPLSLCVLALITSFSHTLLLYYILHALP
jgi:hypothetical protein